MVVGGADVVGRETLIMEETGLHLYLEREEPEGGRVRSNKRDGLRSKDEGGMDGIKSRWHVAAVGILDPWQL